MILATHALSGAVIGKYCNHVGLIIMLSIVVHFILDTFRHGEYLDRKSPIRETGWKVGLDIISGLVVIGLIMHLSSPEAVNYLNLLIGAFFAMVPDGLTFLYWKANFNFLEKFFAFHSWAHLYPPFSSERAWNLKNAANDIIISAVAIILLFI